MSSYKEFELTTHLSLPNFCGTKMAIEFGDKFQAMFGVTFLQRVKLINNPRYNSQRRATVLGSTSDGYFSYWVDGDLGFSEMRINYNEDFKKYFEKVEDNTYPPDLSKIIHEEFGLTAEELMGVEYGIFSKLFKKVDAGLFDSMSEEEIHKNLRSFFLKHPGHFLEPVIRFLSSYEASINSKDYEESISKIKEQQLVINKHLQGIATALSESFSELKKLNEIKHFSGFKEIFSAINTMAEKLRTQDRSRYNFAIMDHEIGKINPDFNIAVQNHSKVFQFLLKFILQVPALYYNDGSNICANIMLKIARIIFNDGNNLFADENQARMWALSFFILSEISDDKMSDDDRIMKNTCYMSLLNDTSSVDPRNFNLNDDYCKKNPQLYINFFELLSKVDSFFSNILGFAIENKNCAAMREFVRLHLLAANAYQSENKSKNAQRCLELAKPQVMNLLSAKDEKAVTFFEQKCLDNFDMLVWLAFHYLEKNSNKEKGKKYLTLAYELFNKINQKEQSFDSQLLFARVLILYAETNEQKEKGVSIFFNAARDENSRKDVLERLLDIVKSDSFLSLLSGKFIYDELQDPQAAYIFFNEARVFGGNLLAEASYYMYQYSKDIYQLFYSAKHGYKKAIDELKNLALKNNDYDAYYYLGLMCLEGINKDDQLAREYLSKVYKAKGLSLGEDKFTLACLLLDESPHTTDIDPIQLFSQALEDKSSQYLALKKLETLVREKNKNISSNIQYEASYILAAFYRDRLHPNQDDYKKATEFAMYCCEINPKKSSWEIISSLFTFSDLKLYVNNEFLMKIFKDLEKFCEDDKAMELNYDAFIKEFLARSKSSILIAKFLFLHSKLREGITIDDIKEALESLYAQALNMVDLTTLIADLIALPQYTKHLLNWLQEHSQILLEILKNSTAINELFKNKDWQEFINSKPIVQLLKANKLLREPSFSLHSVITFFEKTKVDKETLLVDISNGQVSEKQKIDEAIKSRVDGLERKNLEPKKIAKLKEFLLKLDSIKDTKELEDLIQELAKIDSYFELYLPKDKLKLIYSFTS